MMGNTYSGNPPTNKFDLKIVREKYKAEVLIKEKDVEVEKFLIEKTHALDMKKAEYEAAKNRIQFTHDAEMKKLETERQKAVNFAVKQQRNANHFTQKGYDADDFCVSMVTSYITSKQEQSSEESQQMQSILSATLQRKNGANIVGRGGQGKTYDNHLTALDEDDETVKCMQVLKQG